MLFTQPRRRHTHACEHKQHILWKVQELDFAQLPPLFLVCTRCYLADLALLVSLVFHEQHLSTCWRQTRRALMKMHVGR